MTRRPTPIPSIPPETSGIDAIWEDFSLDAPREPSVPPPDDLEVFERDTAIPDEPLDALAAQIEASSTRPKEPRAHSDRPAPRRAIPMPTPHRAHDSFDELSLELAPLSEAPSARPTHPVKGPPPSSDIPPASEPTLELSFEESIEDADSALELVDRRVDRPSNASLATPPPMTKRLTDGPSESDSSGDMQDRYAVGDFTGALVIAESILEADPDHEEAQRYAKSCREVLTQMYAARLGPLDQVATVAVPPEQITWLSLDHRAGFLLSLVDGVSTIEELLDISGMTRLDALRILYTLVQQNVVSLT